MPSNVSQLPVVSPESPAQFHREWQRIAGCVNAGMFESDPAEQ
jgi:hypothetical protein